MACIVAKFGGSSLANAAQFQKVKHILSLDKRRLFIVPSAPGKRFAGDSKVTDLLLHCYALHQNGENIEACFAEIEQRFLEIAKDLGLHSAIKQELATVKRNLLNGASKMYVESRGEYLNGILLAEYLGYTFFDPSNAIYFFDNGKYDSELSNRMLAEALSTLENAVIPGFYGRKQNGDIQTFSRGGSDITGAVVARALCADVYENWTDVSGFLMADPGIVENPLEIMELSYKELRELYYMGANVLHADAIYPVQRACISTNIRNTNLPEHPGTLILHSAQEKKKRRIITGIGGKAGFGMINIEKSMMHHEIGFVMRSMQALYEYQIPCEHMPSSIDSISFVVDDTLLCEKQNALSVRLQELVQADKITVLHDVALLSIVASEQIQEPENYGKIFKALEQNHIPVLCVSQAGTSLSTVIGVPAQHYKNAIRAIYKEYMGV
ncbi:MAG: aspartate kinase [Eubacteriales bacterium]|nr:aspartate kinase [Eubacteriales bacterium]